MVTKKDSSDVDNPTERPSSAAYAYKDTTESPEKTLEELRTEQEILEGQINADTTRLTGVKDRVSKLGRIVTEIQQLVGAYEREKYKKLHTSHEDLTQYAETKKKMLIAALQGREVAIEEAIKEVKKEIQDKEATIAANEKQFKEVSQQVDSASERVDANRRAYENLKSYPGMIQTRIQKAIGKRESIEAAEDNNEYKKMYVLRYELSEVLRKVDLKSVDDFQRDLWEATNALNEAEKQLAERSAEKENARKALDTSKEELATLQQNQVNSILDKLGEEEVADNTESATRGRTARTPSSREMRKGGR